MTHAQTLSASQPWSTPAAFLDAVRTATVRRQISPALEPFSRFAAAGTGGDPDAGFALPETVAPVILATGPDLDPVAARVRRITLDSSNVAIPARVDKDHSTSVSGGFTAARLPISKAGTPTRIEMEQVLLIARTLTVTCFTTNRMHQFAPRALATYLETAYLDEIAGKLLDERLNGTGAGEFDGVINADCTITVAKELGQTADTIIGANVLAMATRCWRFSRAVWMAHPECLTQLLTVKHPTTDAPLLQLPQREEDPFMLLGRPLYFVESCQPLGDKGDLVLGVWSEFIEGELIPPSMTSSLYVRFLERQEVFQFYVENDGKPWWRTALTPKNSAVTLSPFVVLAARA